MKSDGLSMLSQVRMTTPETNPSVEMRKAASGAPVRQDVSFDGRIQPQDAVQSSDSVIDAESVAQAVHKYMLIADVARLSLYTTFYHYCL